MEQGRRKQLSGLQYASSMDFNSLDLENLLAGLNIAEPFAMESALQKELQKLTLPEDEGAERALRVLISLCTLHLQTEEPASTYLARWRSPKRRSHEAADFQGDQTDALVQIAYRIGHLGLRARIADVVWFNSRKHWVVGNLAVATYCELAKARLDGTLLPVFQGIDESFSDVVDWVHRALQLVSSINKPEKWPGIIQETFSELYTHLKTHKKYVAFCRLSYLGASFGLTGWETIACDGEELALAADKTIPPWALHPIWSLAATGYSRANNRDAHKRCISRMVDETLRNRDYVSQAAARASWTRDAIAELRLAGGFGDRIEILRAELRKHQDDSLEETSLFSIDMELGETRAGTIKLFGDLTLPDAFFQLCIAITPPKVVELRALAERNFESSGLGSMFGSQYTDHEGKVTAQTLPRSSEEKPTDAHLKEEFVRLLDIHRFRVVNGYLEPARKTVMTRFPVEERHFRPIVTASPFVPRGHEHIFGLGFARFWQGDYASAVHLLVPQIENSIRHVLLNLRFDSSKMSPDLLQEDRSLSGLLESLRPEMTLVFGEDLINELELLFVHRPGPALRHELAHGKLYDALCYEPHAIYACWFVFHLVVAPLAEQWSHVIAPAIEANSF